MSGEYLKSETIADYWQQLKEIYLSRAENWQDLNQEEYEKIERSERIDSDNHLNEERLGKDTDVIDLAYYKYLPDRKVAYHIQLIHKNGDRETHYFQVQLKE
jgi:hypothetical protein